MICTARSMAMLSSQDQSSAFQTDMLDPRHTENEGQSFWFQDSGSQDPVVGLTGSSCRIKPSQMLIVTIVKATSPRKEMLCDCRQHKTCPTIMPMFTFP